ncbi:hypothetical protein HBN50_17210 [Halobacteriovorax sp. GB3]|uniref:hypothetical protein n=1 Tax=Halobacteriovorax sp. GB3 TaxID=2719615 RepID=UPI00235ECE3A|nr:hypothetical protein [Halobacteriovorax sp. GB3]MDD0854846.1 hypothetical protein [Halobacteriovorax sp. GB3]
MQKSPQWRSKFNDILNTCQEELKKTTEIGKKMLSASKTNTCLHESLEELGSLAFQALENGTLKWEDPDVRELVCKIRNCETELVSIEKDVNKIKFYTDDTAQENNEENKNQDHK